MMSWPKTLRSTEIFLARLPSPTWQSGQTCDSSSSFSTTRPSACTSASRVSNSLGVKGSGWPSRLNVRRCGLRQNTPKANERSGTLVPCSSLSIHYSPVGHYKRAHVGAAMRVRTDEDTAVPQAAPRFSDEFKNSVRIFRAGSLSIAARKLATLGSSHVRAPFRRILVEFVMKKLITTPLLVLFLFLCAL